MANPPPPKKRALSLISPETSSITSSQKWTLIHQQNQLQNLQAELDHERKARRLDQRSAEQTIQQLKQHLTMAQDQAASSRELSDDRIAEKDARIEQLIRERNAAQSLQRRMEVQMLEERAEATNEKSDERESAADIKLLEDKLQAAYDCEANFKSQVEQLQNQVNQHLEEVLQTSDSSKPPHLVEQAPPEVMVELNRARNRCAEANRNIRHLERKVASHEERYTKLLAAHEQSQRLAAVAQKLRTERDEYADELAKVQAELRSWQEFRDGMVGILGTTGTTDEGPPEIATIRKFLSAAREAQKLAEQRVSLYMKERDTLRSQVQEDELKYKKLVDDAREAHSKERENQIQLDSLKGQLVAAEQQALLFQRESESLRQLMGSFEIEMKKKGVQPSKDPSTEALRIQMGTAQDETNKLKELYDKTLSELTASQSNLSAKSSELDSVKEKFGKLRDALMAEREKVAVAEDKVVKAEQLAGKGSFDPSTTRVLHFSETPLVKTLKEEVGVLKRQLEAKSTGNMGAVAGVDPEKLNQRLKEEFKEKISLFREGVYLITGFKIDMLSNTGKPTFRVRSVFAERQDDHLMLQWPKTEQVTSLDILETEFAKALASTPSYQYMTKGKSLPAFIASVQLSLFETQTMM